MRERMKESRERPHSEQTRMHNAIVSVGISWAGLENTLARLFGAIIRDNIGMALYYTPSATETRIILVNTAIYFRNPHTAYWSTIQPIWDKPREMINKSKSARNEIIHGNVSTYTGMNDKSVIRSTRPIFDFRLTNPELSGMIEGIKIGKIQYPGKSPHDVEMAAAKIANLADLTRLFHWPASMSDAGSAATITAANVA
jgi:hypothetical protein